MMMHPAIPAFLTSMNFETDEEVKEDIKAIIAQGEDFRNKIAFDGMDTSKFKDGIDPKVVMKMLTWLADGYAKQLSSIKDLAIDDMCNEFFECLDLLKNNFYKKEYL